MKKLYMVVFQQTEDDSVFPMAAESDCKGALCCADQDPLLFDSRKAARKAIEISKAFARLEKAQGLPYSQDFVEDIKNVKVIVCEVAQGKEAES